MDHLQEPMVRNWSSKAPQGPVSTEQGSPEGGRSTLGHPILLLSDFVLFGSLVSQASSPFHGVKELVE